MITIEMGASRQQIKIDGGGLTSFGCYDFYVGLKPLTLFRLA
jgi:hypothetical protein